MGTGTGELDEVDPAEDAVARMMIDGGSFCGRLSLRLWPL